MRLAAFLLAVASLGGALAGAAEPPNFIVINIDDLGYADIGPFGSKLNRTPHLDRMASEGRKLTCFYAAPVCSPSRSALMTGCYPKRVLPIPGVLFPGAAVGLHPEERTVAEVLKDCGYATACIGKWHLGDQPELLPTSQGFDRYFGIPYSNDMGPASEGAKSDLGSPLPPASAGAVTPALIANHGGDETGFKGNLQPPLPLLNNLRVVERIGPEGQQTITRRYTEAAVQFVREHKDRRFFLYLAHTAVHFPLYPGREFHNKSQNGLFGDWVEEVDWSVGQVLNAVRELQLDRRTLVLFTSDNGGTTRSVNAPLRGNKASTWEGGMRVPTIAWWPGQIPAGSSIDEIAGMFDVLPTFAALAGGKLPERTLDGRDIWPLLSGQPGAKSPHDAFFYYRGLKLEAVRQGRWKLQIAGGNLPNANAKQKANAKAAEAQPFPRLYDLETDIGEANNVAAAHPDVVSRLQALAASMQDDLGVDGIGPGCRALGRVDRPQPLISHDGKIRAGFE